MTKRIGIREVTRNFSILDNYDYVEIEDKKTHKIKGMFVSEGLLEDVREYIEQKAKEKKQKKIDDIMQYAGMVNGKFGDMTAQEIKAKKREKYYE